MPKLRGHHLICLHFFHGEGYDPEFTDNLAMVMGSLGNADEQVEITRGPDDVCRKCRHLRQQMCRYNENADEEIQRMDALAFSLLAVAPGKLTGWNEIRKKLPEIFGTWYASYCSSCGWRRACEKDALYVHLEQSR